MNSIGERTLAVAFHPIRFALLDPFLVPGDQIDKKPWIAMGIAACGYQLIAGGRAPCLNKPNHVFACLRFGSSGLHGSAHIIGADFHKIYFSTAIAILRIFP
jgi:hypothetical protein